MWVVLMLMLAQAPAQLQCTAGETSLVCHCKAGLESACTILQQVQPETFARLRETLSVVQEARKLEAATQASQAETSQAETQHPADSASYESTECKGQQHHVISRPIAKELDDHKTLGGLYQPRDPSFVTRAVDEKAHCGYQHWHRSVDSEVIKWLQRHPNATPKQFEAELRRIYSRPDLQARFPNGF
jgi:hypothetical protein